MKTAVLIDLAFALKRYRALIEAPSGQEHTPAQIVACLWDTAKRHAENHGGSLYRIFCYDCEPYDKGSTNPISNKYIDFRRTPTAIRNKEIHHLLLEKRSVALRRGKLAPRGWVFTEDAFKAIVRGTKTRDQLTADDVDFDLRQKQVDMKLGLDVASLAYKRLVDRIVLIAGDADFVPAAKLARREGIDFVLDPLWSRIDPALKEHIDGLRSFWPRPPSASQNNLPGSSNGIPEQLEMG